MDRKKILQILILMLLLTGLVGCATENQTPEITQPVVEEELAPTDTEEQVATDLPEPTEEPTEELVEELVEEPTEEPAEEPTEEMVAEPVAEGEDHCLNCHTDQQMLIDTAEALEEVESENEGAG
jgi:hypothetical protein